MDVRNEFKPEVVEEVAKAQIELLNSEYDLEDVKFQPVLLRYVKRALTSAVARGDWSNCSRYSQFLEFADIDNQVDDLVESIEVETGDTYEPVVDVESSEGKILVS